MRRLPMLAVALLLPLAVPATAAPRSVTRAWVAERVSANATPIEVNGGAGVADHDYAYAAVAAAWTRADGTVRDAEGALLFGATVDSTPTVTTPNGAMSCDDLPGTGTACAGLSAFAGIGFVVWWDDASFDQVLVVVRGVEPEAGLGPDVRGWELRPWTGTVRARGGDTAAVTSPAGAGAGAFATTPAPGGANGSVAIGHPPCRIGGYAALGAGAVTLSGGAHDVVATCPADQEPPTAAATGATEWSLSGAAAGVADVPVRLVVLDAA